MALRHVGPGEKVRLLPLAGEIADERTAALVKTAQFEAVRLVLPAGSTIPAHAVDGQISLYCLEGAVVLQTTGDLRLDAGEWVYLDGGERHALRAIEDTALLLTILFDAA